MNDDDTKNDDNGLNGTANGWGGADNANHGDKTDNRNNIVHFPTLADRDRLRKEKIVQEEAWRAEYKAKQKALKKQDNPPFLNVGNIPAFIQLIVPVLIIVHVLQNFALTETQRADLFAHFAFVPAYYSSMIGWQSLAGPFTYLFLHGGWMHLTFNVIMLLAMGTFFARNLGDRMAWVFFFVCGLGGAALFGIVHFDQPIQLVGASGAISGYFAVFLVLMYKRGGFQQFSLVRKYGLMGVIGFWLAFMLLSALLLGGQSWEAHIGGFMTGLLLFSWIIRKDLAFWKL